MCVCPSSAGLDYVAVDTVLQFDSVTSVVPVVVTIIDDDILEFDEIFLAALGTTDPAVDLDPDAAQVAIIEDNDGKYELLCMMPGSCVLS